MSNAGIRVVLVETSHPGNIGATARAMKTMGVSELWLVRPKYFPHADATARASGADDLLQRARVVDSLDDALNECVMVAGATARSRSLAWPTVNPREAAASALEARRHGPVALVFGRERSGLTNTEIERCNLLLTIPTHPDYGSLNLAMAVQVVVYEVMMASEPPAPAGDATPPASHDDLERFFSHLESVLLASGFLNPANPRHLMRRLRRLYHRARPDQNEINILRGMLSAVEAGLPDRTPAGAQGD